MQKKIEKKTEWIKRILENGSEVAYSDMIVAREKKKTEWVFKETERVNLRAWS